MDKILYHTSFSRSFNVLKLLEVKAHASKPTLNATNTITQTMVDICPLTKFEGSLQSLHQTEDNTHNWLESTLTTTLTI